MPSTPRRELALAVAGCLVGGLVIAVAAGRPWASGQLTAAPGFPAHRVTVTGAATAPAVRALGYLALAGVVAVPASRGLVRRAVGVVLALAGAVVAARSVTASPAGPADIVLHRSGWPWLAVAGGLVVVAAGALTAVLGPRWRDLSSRYDAPGARPGAGTAPATEADAGAADETAQQAALWDALDRGDDPTLGRPRDRPA